MSARSARFVMPVAALLLALAGLRAAGATPVRFAGRVKELERRMLWEGMRERRIESIHARGDARLHGRARSRRQATTRFERAVERPKETLPPTGPAGLRRAQPAALAGAQAFPSNVRANNPVGDHANAGQSETGIAALGNIVVAAWNDGEGFNLPNLPRQGWGYSTDGGSTWTDGGTPPLIAGWNWFSDPIMSVNEKTSTFYFCAMADSGGDNNQFGRNGVVVVSLTFSGNAPVWGTPRLARAVSNQTAFLDKPWMCADSSSNNVYVSYTLFSFSGFGSDEIDFQRGTNGGASWSAPLKLSAASDNGLVQGSRVAAGPAGEVYAVWYAIGTDTVSSHPDAFKDFFRARRSNDHGATFGSQVNAAALFANFASGAPGFNRENGITFPSLAVDRSLGAFRGRVYVGWNESINYFNDVFGNGATINEIENNNQPLLATPFVLDGNLRGTIATPDTDYYAFTGGQGQTVILYADSLNANLDMSMRLVCGDGVTQLAYSEPGAGGSNLIVFTLPQTGTYYLRLRAPSGSGGYHIATGFAHRDNERARDHRDAFVAASSDGSGWGLVNRVSNSPAGYDDWLPEVAVSGSNLGVGDGHVYALWYDWRDAPPTACGGVSNVYLSRSDDGGQSWHELGTVSDVQTAWTNVASNIAPNQGDYIALFANDNAIYPAWGDGRNGNPDVYTVAIPLALTPVEATLATVTAERDKVTLVWTSGGDAAATGTVERSRDGVAWDRLGTVLTDGVGHLTWVDRNVTPGDHLAYRLLLDGAAGPRTLGPVWVDVPRAARLALAGARPNPGPSGRGVWVAFSLPDQAPATLSLFDVGGRKVAALDVGALGAGDHLVHLAAGRVLDPGLYLVRLTRGSESLTSRATLMR